MRVVEVAVGVIKNAHNVLISRRHDHLHQGGLWEFSGGKIEHGETPQQALARELYEELGITVTSAYPLITIHHDYGDKTVCLRVFVVESFTGQPHSPNGQPLAWVNAEELTHYAFPSANRPIINAARLPPYYAILDDTRKDSTDLLNDLNHLLQQGITLIQARLKHRSAQQVADFLQYAVPLCHAKNAQLLLNSGTAHANTFAVDGLHLTSHHLNQLTSRPAYRWVCASCHNLAELTHAQAIGVDFVVLAPVLKTQTHLDAVPLGWETFARWVETATIPVYALGGLSLQDLQLAREYGAQGISSIRAFI